MLSTNEFLSILNEKNYTIAETDEEYKIIKKM